LLGRIFLKPEDAGIIVTWADAAIRRKDWSTARFNSRLAIAADPDNPDGHFTLAVALAAENRLAEAMMAANRAVELAPEQTRARDFRDGLNRVIEAGGRVGVAD
jgi:hypothetical protein